MPIRHLMGSLAILFVLLLGSGWALAGNGFGPGDGTGPIHSILEGTPFLYVGDIVTMGAGGGLVLATDSGNVTVYGIGPKRYWEDQDVERPGVGDTIEVTGFVVDYNGIERNIAMSIVGDGFDIQLRDPETGLPLWFRR